MDTTPPGVQITGPGTAQGISNHIDIPVEGICEGNGDVELRIPGESEPVVVHCDGGKFRTVVQLPSLDGIHEIVASQRDEAGNEGRDRTQRLLDMTAPQVVIEVPNQNAVSGTELVVRGKCEAGLDVNLTTLAMSSAMTAACPSGTFEQRLALTGADGQHMVHATQTDVAGNIGNDEEPFQKDATPPLVMITDPPARTVSRGPLTVKGNCESGLLVQISGAGLAGPTATLCSGGRFSQDVVLNGGDGVKNVLAQQTDAMGNAGSDNRDFIKDTTAPVVTITAPAAGYVFRAALTLSGQCEDGLAVSIKGTDVAAGLTTACAGGQYSAVVAIGGADGNKTVTASQADSVGNIGSANRTFVKDTTAPVVAITAPAANTVAQTGLTVSGTCASGLDVLLNGAGVATPVTTACAAGAFSAPILFSAGDGAKVVTATQTDAVGNFGTDSRTFIRDGTPPTIAIRAPNANTVARDGLTVSGVCTDGLPVNLSGTGLAAPLSTTCTTGQFSQAITFSAGDGTKNIIAAQTDAAGNIGSDNRNFIRDTTAPVVTITAPAESYSFVAQITLTGRCEDGLVVSITGTDVAPGLTTTCASGQYSAAVAIGGADGNKTVTASQTDSVGNIGSANRTFVKDTTGPAIAITAPAANTVAQTGLTVSGTCATGLDVVLNGAGVATPVTTACAAGTFAAPILFSAGDGAKVVTATQTDAVGNVGSDNRTFIRDTTAPLIAITAPAANTISRTGVILTGTCTDGLPVQISGVGAAGPLTTTCVVGTFTQSVDFSAGDGTKNIIAAQTDAAGNSGSDNRNFIRDTTAPVVTITAPAENYVFTNNINLTGRCEDGLTVAISGTDVAPGLTTACASGQYAVVVAIGGADGNKTVTATQTDAVGNVGNASRVFVKDTTGPAIAITAPAANTAAQTGLTVSGTCTTGLDVVLNGTGVAAAVTTPCAGGAFSAAILFSAGDGAKPVTATQTDAVGNVGTDNRTFIRDTTAPTIAIRAPDANTVARDGVTLSGTCTDGLVVNLSGAGLAAPMTTACATGQFSQAINFSAGEGTKNIIASQTDAAGNSGSDNRNFVRDTTAPVVTITSPAANYAFGANITLTGQCETGLPVSITGTDVASGLTAPCTAGQYSAVVAIGGADGNKTVTVSQTDAVGNTGTANRVFIKDTNGPAIAITAPAANTAAQTGLTVSGTCTTGFDVLLNGAGVATPVTTACAGAGTFSSAILFSNGDGPKVVTASQTDAVGNVGSDSRTFIRDTSAPTIAITAPAANTVARDGVTLSGTCTDGLVVNLSGAGLSAAMTTPCTTGQFSKAITFSAGEGVKNIIASQTDAAGNTGSDNRNFIKDSTPPIVTITAPAANYVFTANITLTGRCEDGLTVSITGTDVAPGLTTNCSSSQYSVLVPIGGADGNKTITASQADGVGNTGSANRVFIKDTMPPAIAITAPAANTTAQTGLTVSGTCATGIDVLLNGAGVATPVTTACAGGNFSAPILFSAGDGAKLVTASQTDAVGNVGSDSRTFIRDNVAPTIAITAPAANTIARTGVILSGTCTDGIPVRISGTGAAAAVTATCIVGTFTQNVDFSAGDGTKNIVASQTDAAGNTGSDNRNFIRDNTAPVVTITDPAAGTTFRTDIGVRGTCEDGMPVAISGTDVPSGLTAKCLSGVFVITVPIGGADGNKTVTASQTDAVGNTGTANRTFVKDTAPPVVRITAPAANTAAKTGLTISGACTAGLEVRLSGPGLATAGTTACVGGTFSANITFSAGDGAKLITASQTDAAGNTGTDSRTFIRDSVAPAVAITDPAAGTVAQTGLTLMGTCEDGLPVQISGSGVNAGSTATCTSGRFSTAITFSNGDGAKLVTAVQTDAAGNIGSDSRSFVRDSTAPIVRITDPAAGTATRETIVLQGNCTDGYVVVVGGSGVATPGRVNCSGGRFGTTITLTTGDGMKNVTVSQTDEAGNVGSDARDFRRDNTPPLVRITAPAAGTTGSPGLTVDGECESGLNVVMSGDIAGSRTTPCNSGAFRVDIIFSGGDGNKNVIATQTDLVGNTGSDSRVFRRSSPAGHETFNIAAGQNKVDILFVDDNSASMEFEQRALANRFSTFAAEMAPLDWQIGITTTDCSTGPFGICGSLLNFVGTASYILTAAVPGFETAFRNTIERPETVDCAVRGTCPSGREEALKATIGAMNKRSTNNAGFFRDDAALAVVILGDEDEQSDGPPSATTPTQVINAFNANWPANKKFISYGIVIQTGDVACLNAQAAQQGGISFYGKFATALATATGGQTVSICAPDYSVTLKQIGENLRQVTTSLKLLRVPAPGTVTVTFTPAQAIKWRVEGDTLYFNTPPPPGTRVDVDYSY